MLLQRSYWGFCESLPFPVFYLMSMRIFPSCMSVKQEHFWCTKKPREESDPLELELQMGVQWFGQKWQPLGSWGGALLGRMALWE